MNLFNGKWWEAASTMNHSAIRGLFPALFIIHKVGRKSIQR